jgi:hypothetical protein
MTKTTYLADPTGFLAHCKSATRDDWRQVKNVALITLIGVIVTIWLPEFFLLYLGATPDLNRAAIDGRLSTQVMANIFTIVATGMIVPRPTRRQTYPILWATLLFIGILCVTAITTHLPGVKLANKIPNDALAAWTAWVGTLLTLILAALVFAARLGEEQLLRSMSPLKVSDEQADDFEKRVGEHV